MPLTRVFPKSCLPMPLQEVVIPRLVEAVNHLLQQEPQAVNRLQAHIGKQLALHAAGRELILGVTEDAHLALVDTDNAATHAALRLDIDLLAMLAAQVRGQPLGLNGVRITGDADFAQEISWLIGHVRWDAEDDLAHFVGDVAAHRIMGAARTVSSDIARMRGEFERNTRDWLAESPRGLVGRSEYLACMGQVAHIRDSVARLDKRVALIARRATRVEP